MITRNPLNRAIFTVLVAGGLTASGAAFAQPQGLYSADELMDADVYSNEDDSNAIGEVEDILLDENMRLHAMVIDTGNLLDMGEKQYVIETGKFTVETRHGENKEEVEYLVTVEMTEQQITQQDEYSNDWWTETKQRTRQAWEETKQTASSAWESTKAATANALNRAGDAINDAGENAEDAATQDTR